MIEPQSFHKILNQSISASKNGLSSIIKSFDTPLPPSVSGPILSPSNGSPVEQSTKRITLCPFESLVNCDGQRPSVGTDYDRNRVRVASYLLEIPLGWTARVARLYFVRFGNGRPRADVTFLHRYVPRMYVRRISNEGEFSWNEITCANACATRCWNCNRDENGIRIIVDVTSFLIRWKGEVEVLETGRTCRFVRLATVYRFGRNLSL